MSSQLRHYDKCLVAIGVTCDSMLQPMMSKLGLQEAGLPMHYEECPCAIGSCMQYIATAYDVKTWLAEVRPASAL